MRVQGLNIRARRGMLLLLVLSMLTVFLMAGALMLVLATRARTTARAFASAANTTSSGVGQPRSLLSEALMALLRGSKAPLPAQMAESILEDKYGTPIKGEAVAGSVVPLTMGTFNNYAPILTATVQNLLPAVSHPCDLNGRILTFKPDAGDGDVASYRILRTTGASEPYTVFLANTTTNLAATPPKKRCDIIINGREFLTEPYDSFGSDPWLTRMPLANSQAAASGTGQASYGGGAAPVSTFQCDNDNDGVADGIWVSGTTGFLPDRPSPLGGTLKYQVSYLVLDLDGRINVNAHGTLVPVTSGSADWPATVTGVSIGSVPVGLGYGPADVDASLLVATGNNTTGGPGFNGRWANLVLAGTTTPAQLASGSNQRRPTPLLGTPVDGRYGSDASGQRVPGAVGASVTPLQQSALAGKFPPAAIRAPTDLNVRMKVFSQAPSGGGVPTLTFYTPDRTADDFVQDPYELRLDSDGARNATLTRSGAALPNDNPFTPAELERVLRQFDSDASCLPPRLAVLLDDYAQRSRMTITTDSWDTPAMGGIAMQKIQEAMRRFPAPTAPLAVVASGNASAVYDTLSPDVTAGLRFDINRPLEHSAVPAGVVPKLKQRFCQHLYTLLVALGQLPNEQTAQWAANVCDFRDPDSTMTRFQYDTNIYDGWSNGGAASVFGAERPEIVITETQAWPGNLNVVLYHPWNAITTDKTNTPANVELVDQSLASGTTGLDANRVKLNRKNSFGSSIWRLVVNGGATIPLGDAVASGGDDSMCKLGPNGYLCVQTAAGLSSLPTLTLPSLAPSGPTGSVLLQRLADPTKANNDDSASDDYNPYITVDEAQYTTASEQATAVVQQRDLTPPLNPPSSFGFFWSQRFVPDVVRPPAQCSSKVPWFHWPNRPFVSVAELALVPTGDANQMLKTFKWPGVGVAFNSLATDPSTGLVDAVHVPSRFAGTGKQIGADALLQSMVTAERVGTTIMPMWREPGRVNVNTLASNGGNTSQPLLDDAVWKAVSGASAPATNPFDPSAGAFAESFTKLLSLSTEPNKPPYVANTATPRDLNPFFSYATAIRMANVATIRSHVFAVWITLKTTDTSATASGETYHRLFAIIDRSIPVGYSKGEDLNAQDTIRLLRFLE